MRYLVAAAMTMAMLTGPAYSFEMTNTTKDPLALKYEREEKERADAEKDYNVQMKRLKAQAPAATKNDPWSGVRPASSGDASAKR